MSINAAGLDVAGEKNPRWKGGLLSKVCQQCNATYTVKRVHCGSRFCSLVCVGISQRGKRREAVRVAELACDECGTPFTVPLSHVRRRKCCGSACSLARRSRQSRGVRNPAWAGGVARQGYPWNFRDISLAVIERDGGVCLNLACRGKDQRMTTHHIDFDKMNCRPMNLICLCSACNSRANFQRARSSRLYARLMRARLYRGEIPCDGGGWQREEF